MRPRTESALAFGFGLVAAALAAIAVISRMPLPAETVLIELPLGVGLVTALTVLALKTARRQAMPTAADLFPFLLDTVVAAVAFVVAVIAIVVFTVP